MITSEINNDNSHILIVDDFKASALFVQSILEFKGYKTSIAYTGDEAMRFIDIHLPNLILLDIVLPGYDGYEVCRRIRMQRKYDDIPIIFMTSKDDEASIARGFDVGAQDYVKKPFLKQELLARIKIHLTLIQQKQALEANNKRLEKRVTDKTQKLDEAFTELQKAYKKIEDINNQLKVLDQAKIEFLQIISHEIRTPLNSILGFSEILQDIEGSDDYKNSVNMLVDSARRLESFAQNAILISELQLNKYQYNFRSVFLKNSLDAVLSKLKDLYVIKHPEILLSFNENLTVYADSDLLNICLFNILENAFRYVKVDGNIEVDAWDEADEIIIEIKDEGKKFNEITLSDPFSLFTKGEEFINKNPGNGLSIIKYIMDSHNGRIELFNITDGVCIKLYFPNILD